jgi:hypothetical protein
VYQLLLSNQRVYRQQTERVDMQGNVRTAVAMLPSELLELNAGDAVDSDVLVLGDTLVSYKAMRNVFFVCQPPVSAGATGTVTLWRNPSYGLRGIDDSRDSVVIFAEGDSLTRSDDLWIHANVAAVTEANACPSSIPSVALTVENVYPGGGLAAVRTGAPVRGFELVQLTTYRDTYGDWWLGLRQFNKSSGWSGIQPLLGPVAAGGLQFAFYDADGSRTTDRSAVARIGMEIVGRSSRRVRTSAGRIDYLVDSLATQVALRGTRR